MRSRFLKSTLRVGGILLMLWFVLFLFTPPMQDTPRAPRIIANVRDRAQTLSGRRFTAEELGVAVSNLHLRLGSVNTYHAVVRYQTPTDWTVTLTPEKRRAYSNPCTLFYRITTLDFSTTEFPDIVIENRE